MTSTDPTAWAIYGRKTGSLRRVVTDSEEARNEADYYDVVPLYPVPAPPADDVREALALTLFRREFDKAPDRWIEAAWAVAATRGEYLAVADAILAAYEVRPRGTVTNAEVRAVQDTVAPEFHGLSYRERLIARRVLEAAAEARNA